MLLFVRGDFLGRKGRRGLGKLAAVMAQPFVEQGVYPPLGRIRFSCEVFVGHLRRYTVAEPLLDEMGLEAVNVVPDAANLLAHAQEGYPLFQVTEVGEDEAGGVFYGG